MTSPATWEPIRVERLREGDRVDTLVKRVTPDEVEAAYAKCGLQPVKGEFWKRGACCGLTAVAILRLDPPEIDLVRLNEDEDEDGCGGGEFPIAVVNLGFTKDYIDGFTFGFDGVLPSPGRAISVDFSSGHDDGASAAKRVRPIEARLVV